MKQEQGFIEQKLIEDANAKLLQFIDNYGMKQLPSKDKKKPPAN